MFHLLKRLKDGNIDGFLLDKYTYWSWKAVMNTYSRHRTPNKTYSCKETTEIVKKTICRKIPPFGAKFCEACYPLRYKECRKDLIDYFVGKTEKKEISYTGDDVAYGILMKNRSHYDFFNGAFRNNKMAFKNYLWSQHSNNTKKHKEMVSEDKLDLFDAQQEHARYDLVFISLGCVLAFILLFGIVYEIIKRLKTSKNAERFDEIDTVNNSGTVHEKS